MHLSKNTPYMGETFDDDRHREFLIYEILESFEGHKRKLDWFDGTKGHSVIVEIDNEDPDHNLYTITGDDGAGTVTLKISRITRTSSILASLGLNGSKMESDHEAEAFVSLAISPPFTPTWSKR